LLKIENAFAPALLLPKKRSKLEIEVASVVKPIVTSKKPLVPLMLKVDGVAVKDDCAKAALVITSTQVRLRTTFFMGEF